MSGSTNVIIGLLSLAVILLGTIAAFMRRGDRRLQSSSPQEYEEAFRQMMQHLATAITGYARDSAALELARTFEDRPEALVQAPRSVQQIPVADWLVSAKALEARLAIVRDELRSQQRTVATSGGSMFGNESRQKLERLEAEQGRLVDLLEEARSRAEAYEQARPAS